MTKVVFKSTSTLMNKVTKLRDGIWKILATQIFTTFAEPDRDIFTSERGSITPEKLGHLQKTMQFLFTNKQNKRKVLFTRGGVEDTRLEAKAKDTKKSEAKDSLSEDRHSRGQGPRTQPQVFSTKKRSSKIFFRHSPIYRRSHNF